MVKIKAFETCLRLPDFALVRPNEMTANKRHGTSDELSLVLGFFQRHPMIPDWPAYPEALVKDARLEGPPKDRALLRVTDDAYWRLQLSEARARGRTARAEAHGRDDAAAAGRHVEHRAAEEGRWRAHFFQDVHHILATRQSGHAKARRLQVALFQFLRAHTLQSRLHELRDTERLIREGFARHASFLAWRLDNLYTMTSTHGIARQKHNGLPLERVLGDVLWDLRRIVSGRHHEWRLDSLVAIRGNGTFGHVHHMPGLPLEQALAEVHWPKLREHSERFARWRREVTVVETPNHGLAHRAGQGSMPEAAAARLAAPLVREHARQALEWHLSRLLEALSNGSVTPAPGRGTGSPPEKVMGDFAWRDRHETSRRHWDWHLSNQMTPTGNGGFAHLKGHHGHTAESVPAEVSAPKKALVTQHFLDWHAAHMFAPTPNHGYAPLAGHGRSLEAVAAEHADGPKAAAKNAADLWHATHRYKETPNHAFAPLKGVGASLESVAALAGDRPKAAAKTAADLWHATHRYKETPNHAFAPLKGVGASLESVAALAGDRPKVAARAATELWRATHHFKETPNHGFAPIKTLGGSLEYVTAAFTSRIKDEVTRRMLERRLGELYTPVGNGTWRRLGHVGKPEEHVAAVVAAPDEGPGALAPLPSAAGRVLQSAAGRVDAREHQQRSVRAFQRNLAAHQQAVSRLQAHVIAPPAPTPAAAALPMAAPAPAKVRKA